MISDECEVCVQEMHQKNLFFSKDKSVFDFLEKMEFSTI